MKSTPFHAGELALQQATGDIDQADQNGRGIGSEITVNAVEFIEHQQLAILATVDRDGQPWCSAIAGPAGGFRVVDPMTVSLDLRGGIVGDDLIDRVSVDSRLGLLFLDVATRRRYRVNGLALVDSGRESLLVRVAEAYANCPKYIQRRDLRLPGTPPPQGRRDGSHLGDDEQRFIRAADTFFVASANPSGDLDASHRGGRPGFVDVDGDRLRIPDYAGNGMYNTLGNLAIYPRAGLLFVDFATGATLQLNGSTALDLAASGDATGGTDRAWTFTSSAWVRSGLANGLAAQLIESSRYNP